MMLISDLRHLKVYDALAPTGGGGVFLAKTGDFNSMNEEYAVFFGETVPARTTVQATLVDKGMNVEIDCVAYPPEKLTACD